MRRRQPLPVKTLTDQQKYLLQRLPEPYQITVPHLTEPVRIRQMRKAIDAWDKRQHDLSCKIKCDGEKLITKAREAIYFRPVHEALALVQKAEALRKCCND